jgi:PLP dependent protein
MIQENLRIIRERIAAAAVRSGRAAESVRMIAVTKTVEPEKILEAYSAGLRIFGENRVQELEVKEPLLPRDIEWHLIGHLQTNKVKKIVGQCAMIQSVDSVRLAEAIQGEAEKRNCVVQVLLEINTSGEASKFGLEPAEALGVLDSVQSLARLDFRGLMTIGPLVDWGTEAGETAARKSFEALRSLRERLAVRFEKGKFSELSMGMSQDFEIAIEEGSTMIRIGTLLFGERK